MKNIWFNAAKKVNTKELDRLNINIHNAHNDPKKMKSYSLSYFNALKQYLPIIMNRIAVESEQPRCVDLLQLIFTAQNELMGFRVFTDTSLDDELSEIAQDFDNNDPLRYEYLIRKIKDKGYAIQSLHSAATNK